MQDFNFIILILDYKELSVRVVVVVPKYVCDCREGHCTVKIIYPHINKFKMKDYFSACDMDNK